MKGLAGFLAPLAAALSIAPAEMTFTAGRTDVKPFARLGRYAGARWDDWANDQDWSLYYAAVYAGKREYGK